MKKIFMFMFMGCLVVLLGFPRPAIANDHIDQVLAGLNHNHQAIGNAIPDLHTLEVGRDRPSFCPNGGLTDKTIFNNYGSSNYVPQYRGGFYGCLNLFGMAFYGEPYPDFRTKGLPNSENQVVNIPSKSGRQLGRYFTRQYPELAIMGVSLVKTPFRTDFRDVRLSYEYDGSRPRVKRFQVGSDTVIWEQIPSNNHYAPTVHQLFIAENTPASEISGFPQISVLSNKGNGNAMSPLTFIHSSVNNKDVTALYFKNFYLVLFGSTSTAINQNTIKNIVQAVTTGNPPPQTPYPNTSFSLPTLTKGQTTNLPIDVSNAFIDPNGDPLTYDIKTVDLPADLDFDKGTNSIIGDPYPRVSGSLNVLISVEDSNHHKASYKFPLTIN